MRKSSRHPDRKSSTNSASSRLGALEMSVPYDSVPMVISHYGPRAGQDQRQGHPVARQGRLLGNEPFAHVAPSARFLSGRWLLDRCRSVLPAHPAKETGRADMT
jgi:hypothetical protein